MVHILKFKRKRKNDRMLCSFIVIVYMEYASKLRVHHTKYAVDCRMKKSKVKVAAAAAAAHPNDFSDKKKKRRYFNVSSTSCLVLYEGHLHSAVPLAFAKC